MRFCQQCTRLQPLAQFDGTRRSCRASLSKRRIRKRPGGSPRGGKRTALYARCGGGNTLHGSNSDSEGSGGGHGSSDNLRMQYGPHRHQLPPHPQWYEASGSASLRSSNSEQAMTSGSAPAPPSWGGPAAAGAAEQTQRWLAARQAPPRGAFPSGPVAAAAASAPPPGPAVGSVLANLSTTDLQRLASLLERLQSEERLAG